MVIPVKDPLAVSSKIVGVIGLGNMGLGIASSLHRAGYKVLGTARTAATRARAAALGIEAVETTSSIAQRADAIVLSLPTSAEVAAVIEGDNGILRHATSGAVVIDTSTCNPESTRRLALALRAKGLTMVDGPVSGGPARAREGALTVMVGCPDEAWVDVEPILNAIGSRVIRIGDVGAGHVAKIANNLLLASHLALAGEVMHLAHAAGVDPAKVLSAINVATGRSMVTEHNFPTWILNDRFDSGFTMGLMRKDVQLAQQLITGVGAQLAVSDAATTLWAASKRYLTDEADFNRIVEMPAQLTRR